MPPEIRVARARIARCQALREGRAHRENAAGHQRCGGQWKQQGMLGGWRLTTRKRWQHLLANDLHLSEVLMEKLCLTASNTNKRAATSC